MLLFAFKKEVIEVCSMGFPHSEISGSKVAKHLPEAYRRYAASFIAFFSQGIHHTPLFRTPARNSENRVHPSLSKGMSFFYIIVSVRSDTAVIPDEGR